MERSTAIVSPNIRLQLTGTKKVQQLLAKPGMVERFMPDQPKKVAALRSTFTGISLSKKYSNKKKYYLHT
jgi:glutathione synthase